MHKLWLSYLPSYLPFDYCRRSPWHRDFISQPWAFPNSQMVGFLADYDSGEIQLQETELHDAQWFSSAAHLPELPPTGTIALKLINATLELCKAEQNK